MTIFFRSFCVFLFSLFIFVTAFPQNAAEYFPSAPGNRWLYSQYELDTLQRTVASTKSTSIDSIFGKKTVNGITGSLLQRKGTYANDTLLLRAEGTTISVFHNALLVPLTSPRFRYLVDSLGFIALMNRNQWFSYLKFGAPTGAADTLMKIDTTIQYNGGPMVITLVVTTTRLSERTVTVPAGTFTATPFLISLYGSGFVRSPIGDYRFRLLMLEDSLFIAKNRWLVKEVQRASVFPYEQLPVEEETRFILPGFIRTLESSVITGFEQELSTTPVSPSILDIFPNPFNPSTTIRYTIPTVSTVRITICDLLGKEIESIDKGIQLPGDYLTRWNAAGRASGIYFISVIANDQTTMQKAVLQR